MPALPDHIILTFPLGGHILKSALISSLERDIFSSLFLSIFFIASHTFILLFLALTDSLFSLTPFLASTSSKLASVYGPSRCTENHLFLGVNTRNDISVSNIKAIWSDWVLLNVFLDKYQTSPTRLNLRRSEASCGIQESIVWSKFRSRKSFIIISCPRNPENSRPIKPALAVMPGPNSSPGSLINILRVEMALWMSGER